MHESYEKLDIYCANIFELAIDQLIYISVLLVIMIVVPHTEVNVMHSMWIITIVDDGY